MGDRDFRHPTAPRPLNRFHEKQYQTRKISGDYVDVGGLGKIASLTHESFCCFSASAYTTWGLYTACSFFLYKILQRKRLRYL